jgi:hypothetical protein
LRCVAYEVVRFMDFLVELDNLVYLKNMGRFSRGIMLNRLDLNGAHI